MKAGYEVIMTDSGPRFAVLLGALADGAKRIPIAVIGQFKKGAQAFAITRQTLADLVANFRRRTIDTVIDYEHASEFPEAAQGGPIPAAGSPPSKMRRTQMESCGAQLSSRRARPA